MVMPVAVAGSANAQTDTVQKLNSGVQAGEVSNALRALVLSAPINPKQDGSACALRIRLHVFLVCDHLHEGHEIMVAILADILNLKV